MANNFINILFTIDNIDRYYIRASIFKAIQEYLKHFNGKLLDVGCGKMPYKEFIKNNSSIKKYIGIDIATALVYDNAVKPDYTWDGISLPFDSESFDTCFATEVLEHCPNPILFLSEVNKVLKPGGIFFFTVPFLWNLHEVPNDEYRYTPFALKRLLKESNFSQIEIKATGGWHAAMAQMLGLWVRRSPLKKWQKKLLSYLFMPIIKYLIKKDIQIDKSTFKEGTMITGLYGIARK
jgi:SAM-dependent methyltransferase